MCGAVGLPCHFFFADFNSLEICSLVESGIDFESLCGGCGGDEIDDCCVVVEWFFFPVHADEAVFPNLASLMAGLVQEYCSRVAVLTEILWLANDPFGNVCLTGILRRISSDVRLGLCRPYESR